MILGRRIHSLDPQRPHVSLFCFAVPIGILQGLFHAFSGYTDAIFASASEAFGKAEDLQDTGRISCADHLRLPFAATLASDSIAGAAHLVLMHVLKFCQSSQLPGDRPLGSSPLLTLPEKRQAPGLSGLPHGLQLMRCSSSDASQYLESRAAFCENERC